MFNWFRSRRQTRTATADSSVRLGVELGMEDRTVPCGADCMMMDAMPVAAAVSAPAPVTQAATLAQADPAQPALVAQPNTPAVTPFFAPTAAVSASADPVATTSTAIAFPPDTTTPTATAPTVTTPTATEVRVPPDDTQTARAETSDRFS